MSGTPHLVQPSLRSVVRGTRTSPTSLPRNLWVSGIQKILDGLNCPPPEWRAPPCTCDPRPKRDGSGPQVGVGGWSGRGGADKQHCFVSGVDNLQLMGSHP